MEKPLDRLLIGYLEVLEEVDRTKPIAMGRWRPFGGRVGTLRVPTLTIFLKHFAREHVCRRATVLRRALSARAVAGDGDDRSRRAVDDLLAAVAPTKTKTWTALTVIVALVLGRVAVSRLGDLVKLMPARGYLDEKVGTFVQPTGAGVPRGAADLSNELAHTVGADVGSLRTLLESFFRSDPMSAGVVMVAFALSLYIVLRPLVPGFRLKRDLMRSSSSGDLYSLERSAFLAAGARAPREFPFDLAVLALLTLLPLTLSAFVWANAHSVIEVSFAAGLAWLAACRLVWLIAAWRRRALPPPPRLPPFVVDLPDGSRAVAREPLTTAALSAVVPYYQMYWAFVSTRGLAKAIGTRRIVAVSGVAGVASALAVSPYGKLLIFPPLLAALAFFCLVRAGGRTPLRGQTEGFVLITAAFLAFLTGWLPLSAADYLVEPRPPVVPFRSLFDTLSVSVLHVRLQLPHGFVDVGSPFILDIRALTRIVLSPVAMWYAQRCVNRVMASAGRPHGAEAELAVPEGARALARQDLRGGALA